MYMCFDARCEINYSREVRKLQLYRSWRDSSDRGIDIRVQEKEFSDLFVKGIYFCAHQYVLQKIIVDLNFDHRYRSDVFMNP